MTGAVFADVFEFEARGQIEIELDGGELPGAADRVDEFDVDFRAVECGFAGDALERDVDAGHGFGESVGRAMPIFAVCRRNFRDAIRPSRKVLPRTFSKPKFFITAKAKSMQASTSLSICDGMQKMWASSWVKPRTRNKPWRTPLRS